MAKLILDEGLATEKEITVQSFFEGNGRFNATGSTPSEDVGELLNGIAISTYKAVFDSGKQHTIYGTYNHASAVINGDEGEPPFESFSVTLKYEE